MLQGLNADVLVLSGGVSAGKFDLVPLVLTELGVTQVFHKVALRPGKPLWFGIREVTDCRTLVFGLPGNPVSSFVCFELFVRPAVAALAGHGFCGLPSYVASLEHDYDHAAGRAACLPARVTPALFVSAAEASHRVTILPWQGSADVATLARANALALLPAEGARYTAGTAINVRPI
jgi:molybdopterin molybdotransferase